MISKIDKNFEVQTKIQVEGLKFYSAQEDFFSVFGVFKDGENYVRMPKKIAETVSDGVALLNKNTSGGRISFKTDSEYVAIHAKIDKPSRMPHMALTGAAAFDLYVKENDEFVYSSVFIPPYDVKDSFEGAKRFFGPKNMREIIINFPLYCDVKEVYIGVIDGSSIKKNNPYVNKKPMVFYGSSITQGGCAQRPGNSYQAIISRKQRLDFVNLGFSGNAKGEKEIAEYIASLDMSLFVLDYDFNAPSVEHLNNTHYNFYKTVREANPDIPIIMVSAPTISVGFAQERIEVIKNTLNKARQNGDNNVYFVNGLEIFNSVDKSLMTVDGVHPTDFGFFCMAEKIGEVIKEVI